MKNKKAAFEMSITTIIIIVISVVMLILGLVFVKTIMCGAIDLAATTNEGAIDQINKLFSDQGGEDFTCMGVTKPLDILPGRYNIVGCGFKSTTAATFTVTYTIVSAKDAVGADIKSQVTSTWITGGLTNKQVSVIPGKTSLGSFVIRPPSDAPEGLIEIQASIKKGTGAPQTETLYFNIKRTGFIQQNVC